MARKNVFGNVEGESPKPEGTGRRTAPNVRYFSQSFQEQMKRSLQDVDTAKIDTSRFADRLDVGEGIEDLRASIRESGQQVPVLLRKTEDGRFQPVYGRRRILACRDLGRPVRAMVVELDEEEALIAQGLENAARLETSYIERALFVAQILGAGFTGVTVKKAIGLDESQISRMKGIVRDIPEDLIRAIGPAHGTGRRPWEELRKLLGADGGPSPAKIRKMVRSDLPSGERLTRLLSDLKSAPKSERRPAVALSEGVSTQRAAGSLTVKAARGAEREFLVHLEETLPELYAQWKANRDR